MDSNYFRVLDKVRALHSELESILNKAAYKTLEDNEGYRAVEHLLEELQDTKWTIEHFSKPVEEGLLHQGSNGRFSINDNELTCGHSLELYDEEEGEWLAGRVEHTTRDGQKGYYFYGDIKLFLHEGMRARIRVKES